MSDFTYQPETGADFSRKPVVISSKFSGYEQRVADGINNQLRTWQLSFSREKSDIDTIESFLSTKGGVTAFTWTPSGMSEVLVICREWHYSMTAFNVRMLSCTFEEVAA